MKAKRVLLASIGSYGDLHPVLGIALELKARGHDVVVASLCDYRQKIERHGIRFVEIQPGLSQMGPEAEWAPKAMDPIKGPEFILREVGLAYARANYLALIGEAEAADLLVGQYLTFSIPLLAEKLEKPWVNLVLQPTLFFSKYDPPVIEAYQWMRHVAKLGPHATGFVGRLAKLTTRSWLKPWHELRRELGLPRASKNPLFEGQFSPDLNLALFSKVFAKPQPDWPKRTVMTGFPLFDVDTSANLSSELRAFLDSGPAPLVFTLGTAAVMTAGTFYQVAASAALELGRSAVLLVGREDRNRIGLPIDPSIHVSDYEPFSKLFPRASIVIHQGGIGTTAQALTSGRPQIICPFSNDQPDNAERVRQLGVSLTLPRKSVSLDGFIERIQRLQADPSFQTKAGEIASRLAAEDGIHRAADAIELLGTGSRPWR